MGVDESDGDDNDDPLGGVSGGVFSENKKVVKKVKKNDPFGSDSDDDDDPLGGSSKVVGVAKSGKKKDPFASDSDDDDTFDAKPKAVVNKPKSGGMMVVYLCA